MPSQPPSQPPSHPHDTPGQESAHAALAALEPFSTRLLPAMLRRAALRRGCSERRRLDLLADLRQELRLDALQHAAAVLQLRPRERHQRWFRLAERWIYRQLRRSAETEPPREPVAGPRHLDPELTPQALREWLPRTAGELLRQLAHHSQHHRNGRCNMRATAGRLGLRQRDVRRLWDEAAAELGFDRDYVAFWRQRLAEALVGLAADLLRDGNAVHVLPGRHAPPDPLGRLRRVRRAAAMLAARPLPHGLKGALSPLRRHGLPVRVPPRRLLALAATLAPATPASCLWAFEAALVDGDHRAAASALWAARPLAAERSAMVLARARLLQARGRDDAARRLLARALRRQRAQDQRLQLATRQVAPALVAGPA